MMFIKFFSIIALVVSIIWFFMQPGFEPGLAIITSIIALISAFLVQNRSKKRAMQKQSVSDSSVGVQAGGNISIGDIKGGKNAK